MYYILNTSSSRERIGFVRKKRKFRRPIHVIFPQVGEYLRATNLLALLWNEYRNESSSKRTRNVAYTWKKREEIWRMTDPLETSEEPWHCRASFRYRYTDRSIGGERSVQFNFPPRHAERGILWILSRNRIMPNTSVPSDFAPLTRNIRKSRSRPPFNEPINSTYGSTILP